MKKKGIGILLGLLGIVVLTGATLPCMNSNQLSTYSRSAYQAICTDPYSGSQIYADDAGNINVVPGPGAQTVMAGTTTHNAVVAYSVASDAGSFQTINGFSTPLSGVNGAAIASTEHCEGFTYNVDKGTVAAADAGFNAQFSDGGSSGAAAQIDFVAWAPYDPADGGCAIAPGGAAINTSMSGLTISLAANGTCKMRGEVCGH